MLFFGHRLIDNEHFYHISSIDAIGNTPPSSTIYVNFSEDNIDIIKHAVVNGVKVALHVEDVTSVVYGNALGVSYLILDKELAKTAQNLADTYLFDSKILVSIEDEKDIEELALLGVDGVICSNAIIKINS